MQSPDQQKAIVQRMIDAGESEENIATVIHHFKTAAPPAPTPTAPQGILSKAYEAGYRMMPSNVQTGLDLGMGAAKGVASTAIGASDLVNRGASALGLTERIQPEVFNQARLSFATPSNATQSAGKFAEQTAEFLSPMGAVGKAKAAVNTGRKMLDFLFRTAAEAASAGGVQTVQTGDPSSGATVGAVTAGMAGATPVVGSGLKWLGERIEKSLVKATKADIENGFKISNVFKHKLGGNLSDSYEKSTERLKALGAEMKAELGRPQQGGVIPQVDVLQALTDASVELTKGQAKTMGQNASIEAAVQKLMDDPVFQTIAQTGRVDLAVANEIKQGIGELGAWKYGLHDPDSAAMEIVASVFYSKLRKAIESAAVNPGKLKDLNRQMGEILPVREAIIRRIPVEQRQNVLNMGDLIGFGTGSFGLAIANRLLRSGQTANVAHKVGEKMANTTLPAAVTQGTVGAGAQIVR